MNCLPNKSFDKTEMKADADKFKAAKMIISVFHKVEYSVGKEENLVSNIFFFFHNVFKRLFSKSCFKVGFDGKG